MIRTKKVEMCTLGMVTLCITQDDDNASDIAQFLLQKKLKRACSGWIVASKTTTEDIPHPCHYMDTFVEFLNTLLENGMRVTNRYVLNMMVQTNYPMAKPSVKCLLKHCSMQQRLELFSIVLGSDINEKCDVLCEILISGSINQKELKSVVSKLIASYPDLLKNSTLTEELERLKCIDSCNESKHYLDFLNFFAYIASLRAPVRKGNKMFLICQDISQDKFHPSSESESIIASYLYACDLFNFTVQ